MDGDRSQLQQHIRKTVGISALRKIRRLVDEYEEERRVARRFTPIGIAFVVLGVLAVLAALYVFKVGPARTPSAAPKPVVSEPTGPYRLKLSATEAARAPPSARYVQDWQARMEAFGSRYFPEVIRDKALYGSSVLRTSIRSDGTVERVEASVSSGNRELDDAAKNLVMRASPFVPFTEELKQAGDTIVISSRFTFSKD
ncbi:MAG TPA: TonB family protein [Burkholderiales bacterium]|nr:TonB family protein [Burkholderiales bacterium]